ncbi:MAG: hypothetical protein ACI97P_000817 [Arcticibacterium sp.]|jgi:hypothetical protein
MFLSSYTFLVEFSHALLFEKKAKQELIPLINTIKGVERCSFYRLITETETDGQNLSLQLFFEDESSFKDFEQSHKIKILTILDRNFAGKYVYFQSLLEAI